MGTRKKTRELPGSQAVRYKKLVTFAELGGVRASHPQSMIVHCHGVFDVLHAGHLAYFESAKRNGDLLVVTLTTDEFVNKGPGRPHFTAPVRAAMLAALEIVDYVCVNPYPTAVPAIEALKPHYYVKGPDYQDRSKDPTGGIYLEEKAVQRAGGKLVFTNDDMHSSSTLINRFLKPWNQDQVDVIEAIKREGGLAAVEAVLEAVSQESVLLIGEPIVDRYTFCSPEAISSKSPTISARYLYEESYAGGSLAIANHLVDFVKDLTLLTTHGTEPWFKELLDTKVSSRVNVVAQTLKDVPTPRKTRYIGNDQKQRFFEITDVRSDQWQHNSSDAFNELFALQVDRHSCLVVADFGHGLIEDDVLALLGSIDRFIGLNVQTNSSNLGFNLFTKHKRYDYLSIDEKEAKLGLSLRNTSQVELAQKIHRDHCKGQVNVSMTRGPSGAFYLPAGTSKEFGAPAFTDSVVDAIGAGDAYFGLTSLLVKVGAPPIMVPFLGNIFAGLKTKIVGNKFSVSKSQLLKAVTSMLK